MYNRHRGPLKISSRMKSDQRVGMKVAGDGLQDGSCKNEGCRMKVARMMAAEVKVAAVVVEGAAVVSGAAVGA